MYCRKCGNELGFKDKFCGVCGEPVVSTTNTNTTTTVVDPKTKEDLEKVLFVLFGIFAPLICLIFSLIIKNDKPEAAKIGIIVSISRLYVTIMSLFLTFIKVFF